MFAQIADTPLAKKTSETPQITQKQEDFSKQRMFPEELVIQAFQEAVSRIGGQHSELSDVAYLKLLLDAKYQKICQMNQ